MYNKLPATKINKQTDTEKEMTKLQITKTTEESTERYLYAKRKITTSYLPMLDIRLKQRANMV
jgi:hypothetical protein